MKFTEIKVGGEYYFDRGRDWLVGSYYLVYRAVVVDSKRYRWSSLEYRWTEDPRGTGLLCELYDPDSGRKIRREHVRITHLRGRWAETKATVDANKRLRRERQNKAVAESRRQHEIAESAILIARTIGLNPRESAMGRIVLDSDQFDAMVTQLSQAGWRYEGVSG